MTNTLLKISFFTLFTQLSYGQCIPPAAPNPVTATPGSVCSDTGTVADLVATATVPDIQWYTTATGGAPIGTSTSGAAFSVNPSATTTYYAEALDVSGGISTTTFTYTGAVQTFVVPAGVTSIEVDAYGASGGAGNNPAQAIPGLGGRTQATFSVTPGETLEIYVGGSGVAAPTGTGGFNGGGTGALGSAAFYSGGGGGGASDIRVTPFGLADRILVAGGGGGGGADGCTGNGLLAGAGGGLTGGDGATGTLCVCNPSGTGGTQIAGGTDGSWACSPNCNATSGGLGVGGNGNTLSSCGGTTGGGGGGGGFYGGGGGGLGSGGGGSNFASPTATGVTHTQGVQSGNGSVLISYTAPCVSLTRTAVTVTINPIPVVGITPPAATTFCDTGVVITLAGTPSGGTFSGSGMVGNDFSTASAGIGTHNITYTYTSLEGCSNTDSVTLEVVSCAGLDNLEADELHVYPNPTSDKISIELSENMAGHHEFSIVSMDGKSIKEWSEFTQGASTITVDVSKLNPGVYYFVITGNSEVHQVTWIKK